MYDNLLFNRQATVEFTGRAGVLDVPRELNLPMSQALDLSDHLPIWAEFSVYEGGQPGRMASRERRSTKVVVQFEPPRHTECAYYVAGTLRVPSPRQKASKCTTMSPKQDLNRGDSWGTLVDCRSLTLGCHWLCQCSSLLPSNAKIPKRRWQGQWHTIPGTSVDKALDSRRERGGIGRRTSLRGWR